jgi:hypothetical protein
LRESQEVDDIREAKAQAAQQAQQMGQMEQGADIVEKGSKIDLNEAKAAEATR